MGEVETVEYRQNIVLPGHWKESLESRKSDNRTKGLTFRATFYPEYKTKWHPLERK